MKMVRTRTRTVNTRFFVVACLTLFTGASCVGDDSLSLDSARWDEEEESLRRRLNIVVRVTRGETTTTEEITPEAFENVIDDVCGADHAFYGLRPPPMLDVSDEPNCSTGCNQAACDVATQICAANAYLQLIQQVDDTETFWTGAHFDADILLPPQSPETGTALAHLAYKRAVRASAIAADAISGVCSNLESPVSYLSGALAPEAAPNSYGALFVSAYEDSFRIADESLREGARLSAAVSDASFSEIDDVGVASRRAWTASDASRAWAAHLIVGGAPGLEGMGRAVHKAGFCPTARLSGGATEALRLLRLSGVSPAAILLIDDIDALMVPFTDPIAYTHDSVRQRLAIMMSRPEIATLSASELYAHFGLTRQNFADAHQRLREELYVFQRSAVATSPPMTVVGGGTIPFACAYADPPPGGGTGACQYYPATATEPRIPLSTSWSAILSYEPNPPAFAGNYDTWEPTVDIAATGEMAGNAFVDAWIQRLEELIGSTTGETQQRLAFLLSTRAAERSGRASACVSSVREEIRLDVYGVNERLFVVFGHDGLQCAVRGAVEGAPCDLTDYIHTAGGFAARTPSAATGFSHAQRVTLDLNSVQGRVEGERLTPYVNDVLPVFVVRATSFDLENTPLLTPGTFEEVTGWFLPDDQTSDYCLTTSIVPAYRDLVSELMSPNPEYCAFPAEPCAGVGSDLRIPLENELTTDGDSLESSWRHYLQLARSAADHADQLGEDLILAGMELDSQVSRASSELEDICGVPLSVGNIGDIAYAPTDGACTDTCAGPYACRGGTCVLDFTLLLEEIGASSSDAAKLEACIGEDASVPHVALGTQPLCAWEDAEGVLCAQEVEDQPCPYYPNGAGCSHTPEEMSPVHAETFLSLFPSPADPRDDGGLRDGGGDADEDDGTPSACELLAQLREDGSGMTDLLRSGFVSRQNFEELAGSLQWAASAGDYSQVLWDGATVFSTGTPERGPSMLWPCAAPPTSGHCPGMATTDPTDYSGPLFCLQGPGVCGPQGMEGTDPRTGEARVRRARMNDLLARAVMAARLLGGHSLAGMRVPFYPRARDSRVDVVADSWGTQRSGVQRAASGSLGVDQGGDSARDFRLYDFTDLGIVAQRIAGTSGPGNELGNDGFGQVEAADIPTSAEWVFCPYDWRLRRGLASSADAFCVEIFDDQRDADDYGDTGENEPNNKFWDHDLPLLVRTLPRSMQGTDPNTYVANLWRSSLSPWRTITDLQRAIVADPARRTEVSAQLALPSHLGHFDAADIEGGGRIAYPLSQLTNYWRRSGCGTVHGGNCDHEGRSWEEEDLVMAQGELCFRNYDGQCGTVGCDDWYQNCVSAADEPHGIDFHATFDGNRAFIAPHGLTRADILNGMELLCVVSQRAGPSLRSGCGAQPPPIETVADFQAAAAFLECQATNIRNQAALSIVNSLPARVVELISEGASGEYGGTAGEYREAVSELRAAFIELRETNEAISREIDGMATQLRRVRNAVAASEVSHQLENLSLGSQIADRVTQCVVAVGQLVSAHGENNVTATAGAMIATTATCANASIQIYLATEMSNLRHQGLELQTEQAFIEAEGEYNRHAGQISVLTNGIQQQLEMIDARLARIESIQRRGQRALANLMFQSSDDTGRFYGLNAASRARYDTALFRYREAHRRAVRLAYIAKVALEQRLGMPLDTMTEDLRTVEAPHDWHMDICRLPAIDYDSVRRPGGGEVADRPPGYAGSYVGDYVRRLEQVFESYNFRYPFADGADTAVLSLRDDIHRVRASCPVEVPNLLYQAGHLHVRPRQTDDGPLPGWEPTGCADFSEWPEDATARPPSCVQTTEVSSITDEPFDTASPIGSTSAEFGRVPGYLVEFGTETAALDPLGNPVSALTADTQLVQWVSVPAGRYRVSWYARSANAMDPAADIPALQAVGAISATGASLVVPGTRIAIPASGSTWQRYYTFVDVATPQTVGITISPVFEGAPRYRVIELAALMLEDVSRSVSDDPRAIIGSGETMTIAEVRRPGTFFDTGDVRERNLPVCEDTTGYHFRRTGWSYACVRECPDGYGGSCRDEVASERCFYETTFSVSSDLLQRNLTGTPAGFAAGNYNYRIDSVALNLVGTDIRSCDGIGGATPSTCYASGNVSYSLLHGGPYPVRNARGELYDAPLFPGRIERARALMAERYVTNPLSSTDRALVEPYARVEFRGRPLGGQLNLRIWDDPGLQFDRLEDVQIVLNYRYWTRQE